VRERESLPTNRPTEGLLSQGRSCVSGVRTKQANNAYIGGHRPSSAETTQPRSARRIREYFDHFQSADKRREMHFCVLPEVKSPFWQGSRWEKTSAHGRPEVGVALVCLSTLLGRRFIRTCSFFVRTDKSSPCLDDPGCMQCSWI